MHVAPPPTKANHINMSLSTHVNIRFEIRTGLASQTLNSQKNWSPPTLCDPGEEFGIFRLV